MTDRELLELAARAAGYKKFRVVSGVFQVSENDNWNEDFANWVNWNPLTDPGDALQLAVQLELCLEVTPLWVCCWDSRNVKRFTVIWEDMQDNNSKITATMRAITRAAAEIGRAKP